MRPLSTHARAFQVLAIAAGLSSCSDGQEPASTSTANSDSTASSASSGSNEAISAATTGSATSSNTGVAASTSSGGMHDVVTGAVTGTDTVTSGTTSSTGETSSTWEASSTGGETTTQGGMGGSTTSGTGGTGGDTGSATVGGAGGTSSSSGGTASTTGVGGTGGLASGCPLDLEGFATVNADGQNGTYGGRDGSTVTVTSQSELDQYATASEPYVIRVQGAITLSPKGTEIRVASNKTIVGVGTTGEIAEGGFFLAEGVHNVIIRNLTVRDTYVEGDWEGKENDFDGVQMDTAHHVWIDHCHFHHLGDGIIDSRKDTTYLTVSWNILSDHNKTFGIGWTDNVTAQMTIHHNWLRDVNQRNPSVDNVLRAHLYNNFLQRVASYGNYARGGTNMVLENSVFDSVKDPHYGDDGSLVARGNIYRNTSGQQETFGSQFFDPNDYYSYRLDPASEIEALLAECAGPRPELGQ